MRSRLVIGPALVSFGVLGIGLVVLMGTLVIPDTPLAQVGPKLFPAATGIGLLVLGILLAVKAFTGGWSCEATDPAEPKPDLVALAWVVGGFAAVIALIDFIGFVLASTILFALSARAFGERRWALSLGLGFAIAFLAYVGFARLLGLRMGEGFIESMI